MPSFHEVRLPDDIEKGASGGPRFSTTVMELSSGHEKRNVNWSQQRGHWDIGYGIQYKADALELIIDFFYARMGRAYGFRFRDWADYQIGEPGAAHVMYTTTNTTTYQIIKKYTSGATTFTRTIKKIVANSVSLYLNAVLVNPADYTVDNNTGIIVFDSATPVGQTLAIICEFDVPVRFDTDELSISMETFNAGAVPSIPIIELRV